MTIVDRYFTVIGNNSNNVYLVYIFSMLWLL